MSQPTLHLQGTAEALDWLRQCGVTRLTVDSRQVAGMAADGVAFIAWPGAARDGRAFVAQALKDGARACMVEAEGLAALAGTFDLADARVACLSGLKSRSAEIAHGFFGEPSAELDVVAVTGTNGKTSVSWWTAQALSALGRGCGVIGTLGVGQVGTGTFEPTGLTTPDPITLHATFRRFADQGLKAAAIEASSIGIEELRLHATHIKVAQFTNFTQDHLDYHLSMEAYWAAKRRLFDWPDLQAVVLNMDDPMGPGLLRQTSARHLDAWTYSQADGQQEPVRLRATEIHYLPQGLAFDVIERSASLIDIQDRVTVHAPVIGAFNVANLLAVIGGLRALGVSLADAARVCRGLHPVPGRMQIVDAGDGVQRGMQPMAVVDYAHTPDALLKAIEALRPVANARGGRLWCVFGCGGDRDPVKRPLMGAIAEQHADHLVLTSDNPRTESPAFILSQILAGVARRDGIDVIEDRREAIAHALMDAADRDVVLIAGKGHEAYQEVSGRKHPFSDVDEARAALSLRAAAHADPRMPMMMTLGLAHELLPGSVLSGDPATPIARVHTDTRTLQAGDLFIALRGERFDAHDFLPQAAAAGAVAVIAQHDVAGCGLPGLTVPDTRAALGMLAAGWRARFNIPLIAVTGSNGKTTVTQMIASILRNWVASQGAPYASLATQGNFNNDIGLPLTLLRLREGRHLCAVVELGMNHPGEIAQLAAIAAPTVAVVNNAQREHQEFMHTVEAVARENGAVLQSLTRQGVAVFPADDVHTPIWRALANGYTTLDFATPEGGAAVSGSARWVAEPSPHWVITLRTPQGQADVTLKMAGAHNVRNALAAAAAALGAGVPLGVIAQGLAAFEPVKGRSQLHCVSIEGRAVTLIDDSYNANPDSVRAAIDMLVGLPGPHWLVLGDMGEVGTQGPLFHMEVGAYARERGVEHFWTAGELCAHAAQAYDADAVIGPPRQARHFNSAADIVAALPSLSQAPAVASVLVKGSRFMKMEQVVTALSGGAHAA